MAVVATIEAARCPFCCCCYFVIFFTGIRIDRMERSWLTDVFVGAIGSGVNVATFVVLNLITLAAFISLLFLLFVSYHSNPSLVPHVYVLLLLTAGLCVSLNWFILSMGFTDAAAQKEELFGKRSEPAKEDAEAAASGKRPSAASVQRRSGSRKKA